MSLNIIFTICLNCYTELLEWIIDENKNDLRKPMKTAKNIINQLKNVIQIDKSLLIQMDVIKNQDSKLLIYF